AVENGRWVIASHQNYPADAENQMRDAAAGLIDIKGLAVASDVGGDHELYGVVEPDQSKLKVGDKGVGTLVAMQDEKGNDLMRLVVGKPVEGAAGHHFVRKPAEERVWVAELNLDKLSTEFDKWIEKDLLKLSPFDVSKVTLKDYSLLPTQTGTALLQRMEASLTYDSAATSPWSLDKMIVYSRSGEPKDAPLTEQEELNKQKLDDLRNGLDDLKIIDVARKPESLGKLLKEGLEDFSETERESLASFGFVPARGPDGTLDLFASNGELIVDMKDGVRYVLRFGKVASAEQASSTAGSDSGAKDDVGADAIRVSRYLFVSAQLSPLTLTQPMLEPEPAGPENPAPETPAGKPAEKPADDKAAAEGDDPDAPKTEPAADPAKAERERIKRENDRKMTEYREKKIKAENRVKELNARFADWYYVVSEDIYKKLRLSRADFVKEAATAAEEGFGVDAFRNLEDGGVKGVPAPAAGSLPTTPSPAFPSLP
ncbi:MAG TPA: DUF4340 domain-containing protein, partial [Pirellulaceae bacterium]|nr:DUF4340 domain-containing protein [Pirellulaceae bacterium]